MAMPYLAFHFSSGDALFSGALLLLLGLILCCRPRFSRQHMIARLLSLVGIILISFSATPFPIWFYTVWAMALIFWLVVDRRKPDVTDQKVRAARLAVLLPTLAAPAWELLWRAGQRLPQRSYSTLYVIGDSLSAGMFGPNERTWPRQLKDERKIDVIDLSREGETVTSALNQAALVNRSDAVVLIEIGGNDLLSGKTSDRFADDLDALLGRLRRPGRQLMMLELPLPPFYNEYGRIQRTLSRKYDVVVVPRRSLAGVIFTPNATVDGIHLTKKGHRLMAQVIWKHTRPAFEPQRSEPAP